MTKKQKIILALDIGEKRVGVAIADTALPIVRMLKTLPNDNALLEKLSRIVAEEKANTLVAGLPRGLDGQETAQTAYARRVAAEIGQGLGLPVIMVDEALTSVEAEEHLKNQDGGYVKEDIDQLAAKMILEDYLSEAG